MNPIQELAESLKALGVPMVYFSPSPRVETQRTIFTPSEVGKMLRTDPTTVISWIRSGQLKASNLATGNRPRYVIQATDLQEFLRLRQPQPPVARNRKSAYRRFSQS